MAKRRFIAIYGGTQLSSPVQQFVAALAREVVENPDYVLVTGGFRVFEDAPEQVSTDWVAASAARSLLEERGLAVDSRLETWLPDEGKDRSSEGVRRFEAGAVRRRRGESHRARRFALAWHADAILTISGSGQTGTVLDLAETIGKPALPLPFTGNDSAAHWANHRESIQRRFRIDDATAGALEKIDLAKCQPEELEALAKRIVHDILPQGMRRRCLVLMPFRAELDAFYTGVLEAAIEDAGFEPVRIDRSSDPGDIQRQFFEHLERCEAFLVDITGGNPNVMYELGHAHARRIEPLLIHRGAFGGPVESHLPFYLLQQKVESCRTDDAADCERLRRRIAGYLKGIQSGTTGSI